VGRFVCGIGSQHILEVFGADIGTFGCWDTGEFLNQMRGREERRGEGGREELIKSSGHPAMASTSSLTTGFKNTSRASTSALQCKTT